MFSCSGIWSLAGVVVLLSLSQMQQHMISCPYPAGPRGAADSWFLGVTTPCVYPEHACLRHRPSLKSLFALRRGVNSISYQIKSLLPSFKDNNVPQVSPNYNQAQKGSKPHVAVLALTLEDLICSHGSHVNKTDDFVHILPWNLKPLLDP